MGEAMKCQSEHERHGDTGCQKTAMRTVHTIYGRYEMCNACANSVPLTYLKAPRRVPVIETLAGGVIDCAIALS